MDLIEVNRHIHFIELDINPGGVEEENDWMEKRKTFDTSLHGFDEIFPISPKLLLALTIQNKFPLDPRLHLSH